MIAFLGSVFSPYYKRARSRRAADPIDHSAINIALYGAGNAKRWAMTERPRGRVERDARHLRIGPSELHWDGNALTVTLDEITVPWPSRIRGQIRLYPKALATHVETLDADAGHRWQPIAPCARVEVKLDSPHLNWSGEAYLDSNAGDAPVEDSIQCWHWSRSTLRDGTAVIYDVAKRNGEFGSLALRFNQNGDCTNFDPPPRVNLPRTGWRIERETRADGGEAAVIRTLEDTPFYARSVVSAKLLGETTIGVHESLNLDRFRQPIVQLMLPFRMPRSR